MAWRKKGEHRVVGATLEFRRVRDLARRKPPDEQFLTWLAEELTEALRLPHAPREWYNPRKRRVEKVGLRPLQAWALAEAFEARGLIASLGVGAGKTLLSFLLPTMLGSQRPLIILPATLIKKKTLTTDLPEAQRFWDIHPHLRFVSYEALSRENQAEFLERGQFDIIIPDEAHRLRYMTAAATRRMHRYLEPRLDTASVVFCPMSGTIMPKSLRDVAHMAKWALRDKSPFPRNFMDIETWSDALDIDVPDDCRPHPGALLDLRGDGDIDHHAAFQRRLQETPGYVFGSASDCNASILCREWKVDLPKVILDEMEYMRARWKTPGGEEVSSSLEFAAHMSELVMGCYYRWVWPNGKPNRPWLRARRAWKKFVRDVVKGSAAYPSRYGRVLDTEQQVANAVIRGQVPDAPCEDEPGKTVYARWAALRDSVPKPPTEAVWIDDTVIDAAVRWLESTEKGVLWVEHKEVLNRLRTRWPRCYGAGENAIEDETETCVASIDAHYEGKNLPQFSRALFLGHPGNAKQTEQLWGRHHRDGQQADELIYEIYLPCMELWKRFEQARIDACGVELNTGQSQKLLFADIDVPSEEEVTALAEAIPMDVRWRTDWPQPTTPDDRFPPAQEQD